MQMVDTSECNMPKSDADRANVIATRYEFPRSFNARSPVFGNTSSRHLGE
jgi:hypothetical protein